jgi:hypothetical protein
VFEKDLAKDATEEFGHSGLAIKFTLAIESREGVSAGDVQDTNTISKAIKGINAPSHVPPVVGPTRLADDTGSSIVSEVQKSENPFNILLQRMELLNQIVVDIAEVSSV